MPTSSLLDIPLRRDVQKPFPADTTPDERNPEKLKEKSILPPGVVESEVASDNRKFYSESQDQQWPKQLEFIINLGYIFAGAQGSWGSQWLTVGGAGANSSVKQMRMPGVASNMHVTANILWPAVRYNLGRLVGEAPDCAVVGLTQSKRDMAAAEQAEAIIAHVDQNANVYAMIQRAGLFMMAGGCAVYWGRWDNKKWGEVATKLDADGSVEESKSMQVGDIDEEILNILSFFPDYKASRMEDCERVTRAFLRPVTWVKEQTGVSVKGGNDGLTFVSFDQLATLTTGDYNFKKTWSDDQCLILDTWHKPTGDYKGSKYPNGLRVMSVRDKVIFYGDLPEQYATSNQWHPAAMSYWGEAPDSIWGVGPVSIARPLQDNYNAIRTNYVQRLATEKPMVLTNELSGVEPGKTTDTHLYDTITVDNEMGVDQAVRYFTPPAVGDNFPNALQVIKQEVQDIFGSHELSPGATSVSMNDVSGEAIEKLQIQDSQSLGMVYKSVLNLMRLRANIVLTNFRQYCASIGRLLAIDQSGNPGYASKLLDYEAFMGGSYRVIAVPSSYNMRHPAARQEIVERYFNMGAFGPVGTPAAIATFIELQESIMSSDLLRKILARVMAQIAATPNPAQAQQQLQMTQLQGELQLVQAKGQQAMQQTQFEATMDQQTAVKKAMIDAQSDQVSQRYKYMLEQQTIQDQNAQETQRLNLQSQNALIQAQIPKVSIAITDPTPAMIGGAGVEAGLIPPTALGQATQDAQKQVDQENTVNTMKANKPPAAGGTK